MFRRMRNSKGFSLAELLVVLVIIGVLAAVATPLYMHHSKRAKAAEAVATMGLIRQAERDYRINRNAYFSVAEGNIQNALPSDPNNVSSKAGLEVNVGVSQYFSNDAFSVLVNGSSANFTSPGPVDFLIVANGDNSQQCGVSSTDCAVRFGDVSTYKLEMDNSGRIFVSYDKGANWSAY